MNIMLSCQATGVSSHFGKMEIVHPIGFKVKKNSFRYNNFIIEGKTNSLNACDYLIIKIKTLNLDMMCLTGFNYQEKNLHLYFYSTTIFFLKEKLDKQIYPL